VRVGVALDRRVTRPALTEILGLTPWRQRLHEARLALRGDPFTPASRFDHTSLRILEPRLSWALWRGKRPYGRRVPLYNLFNHTPTPIEDGWSVRKTQVRDFRGGTLTYDSHNGTDFATPPGTIVVAPAPGRVALVANEFNRGGLKVMLDHGDGLCTTAGHLARALVEPGQHVARGQPIALSGASGLNFVGSLLADPPHVHFNVWLDGTPVDPFARPGETALWRTGNEPAPHDGPGDAELPPSHYDHARLDAWVDSCRDPALAARLAAIADPWRRACETLFAANYYPTKFARTGSPYRLAHARTPRLDLPFSRTDYDGVTFAR
jgi:murein DD-endopeptidase MepM/ murein hydrolase activator NlpD